MPSLSARILAAVTRATMKRPFSGESFDLQRARKRMELVAKLPGFLPRGLRVERSTEPLLQGEWLIPADVAPRRTILYLHGGGYFACSPRTHRALTAHLAVRSRARVLALDYRLAPEHKFPAALDDAVAALRAFWAQGMDPHAVGIAGDSAGGGLALAAMMALRDAREPVPAAAALFSPWTDLAGTGDSMRENADADAMLPAHLCGAAARLYAGSAPLEHPYISPFYGDFAGLPSLLVHVGDTEILLDDSLRVVEKARTAGIAVECEVWNDLPHAWPVAMPYVKEARLTVAGVAAYFARQIG